MFTGSAARARRRIPNDATAPSTVPADFLRNSLRPCRLVNGLTPGRFHLHPPRRLVAFLVATAVASTAAVALLNDCGARSVHWMHVSYGITA